MTEPLNMMEHCNVEVIPSDRDQFSEGRYAGRKISFIKSPTDDALIVRYEISGRSTGSRSRIMTFYGGRIENSSLRFEFLQGDNYRLKTIPLDKVAAADPNKIYEAAHIIHKTFVVVSNGQQTDNLYRRLNDAPCDANEIDIGPYIENALRNMGPETDFNGKFCTARIAGVARRVADADFELALGSIDRRLDERGFNLQIRRTFAARMNPGEGISLSTYNPDTPWMDLPNYSKCQVAGSFKEIVESDWKAISNDTVTERKTGNVLPTRTSVAWMNIPFDPNERGNLLVKNEFKRK